MYDQDEGYEGVFFFYEKVMKGVVLDIYPDNRIFPPR